jgi:2-amino-4-hydroxy-6-hydroxymethyldihydropteridine diphosphokinase
MIKSATILISLKTFSSKGTGSMRKTLSELSEAFNIEKVSSVYKVDRPAESLVGLRDIRKEERLDGYAMVLRANTKLSPKAVLEKLLNIETQLQQEVLKRTVSLNLLIFENEIIMLPGLSVPHPEMHLRPEEIVPAVEVWGEFVHPVLKETLSDLSRRFVTQEWGEFFEQGTPLLDFSNMEE